MQMSPSIRKISSRSPGPLVGVDNPSCLIALLDGAAPPHSPICEPSSVDLRTKNNFNWGRFGVGAVRDRHEFRSFDRRHNTALQRSAVDRAIHCERAFTDAPAE